MSKYVPLIPFDVLARQGITQEWFNSFHEPREQEKAQLPRRFRRLIERVGARDREWFEKHPSATHMVRPYAPGEFAPRHSDKSNWVLVTQVAPGWRRRELLDFARIDATGPTVTIVFPDTGLTLLDVPVVRRGVGCDRG